MTDLMFLLMVAICMMGFACAFKTTSKTPFMTRLALLSPMFASLYAGREMVSDKYVAYGPDIFLALSTLAVYVIIALILRGKSPLKIDLND